MARPARRRTAWFGAVTDPVTIAPGGQGTVDLSSPMGGAVGERQGMTIARIRGILRANSTDANLSCESAFGIIMVENDAALAGAFPDPIGDESNPWLWWQRRVLLPPSDAAQHIELDVRAMRRFRAADDTLRFMIDNDDAAQTLEFVIGFRLLVLLS